MLVAPRWKHLAFTFGSSLGPGDLQNIRNAQQPQLANLPCARILVREPSADELVVFSTRRVGKNRNARCNAAVHEVRRFERPTTSAHPAWRRTGSRMEGTATMAAAANATTATIGARPGRRELMLGFISNFHVGTWRAINFETTRPSLPGLPGKFPGGRGRAGTTVTQRIQSGCFIGSKCVIGHSCLIIKSTDMNGPP
jgi:hypothetical protein